MFMINKMKWLIMKLWNILSFNRPQRTRHQYVKYGPFCFHDFGGQNVQTVDLSNSFLRVHNYVSPYW